MKTVSFGYTSDLKVLHDIDLDLPVGLTLLVGPNGCGKSTLLKIAAGVEKPDHGQVLVGDRDLWRDEVAARTYIAYLPEHPDLTPYATVFEILRLVCGLRGRPLDEAWSALEWVGLESLGERTIRELSKGQRRRATLAAARIGTPSCLLFDEPIEGMDRAFREILVDWIGRHVNDGGTAIVVSHEFEVFAPFTNRAVTVRDSRCFSADLGPSRQDPLEVLEGLARGEEPQPD